MVKKKSQLCYGFENLATEMAWISDGYTLMPEEKGQGVSPVVFTISVIWVSSGYSAFYLGNY